MSTNKAQLRDAFRQLLRCSRPAKKFAGWLGERSRGTKVTKVRVASRNVGVGYGDIVALFKVLEILGFGDFVEGRHGRESRMVWSIDIKSISQEV